MKTIVVLAALAAAILSPGLGQAADISPLPSQAGLSYFSTASGDTFLGGVASWQIIQKAPWNRLKVDVVTYGKDADPSTWKVTLGLGVDLVNPVKRLHLGASLLLPSALGHVGWYAGYTLLGEATPVIATTLAWRGSALEQVKETKTLGLNLGFDRQRRIPAAEYTWRF